MYNFLSKQGLEAMIGIIENRIAGIGFTFSKLNFPNLIATKIKIDKIKAVFKNQPKKLRIGIS